MLSEGDETGAGLGVFEASSSIIFLMSSSSFPAVSEPRGELAEEKARGEPFGETGQGEEEVG